jgi:hypothetical protein
MSPNFGGDAGCCGVSANEYSCAHEAQINFGDLIPYLTYDNVELFRYEYKYFGILYLKT